MENQEKKILIDVKILDNFVTTKKNTDEAKKALNDFIKSGEKNEKLQRELAQTVAKTNNEFKEAKTQLEAASKSQGMLAAVGDKTNKTLGEMQRELKALKNTPLDFGDPAQVREVEMAMAKLTDEIGDYKAKIQGLDTSKTFANVAEGLEFAVSGVSALSNGMKALGVENEVLAGLESKTTELIATVQALGVVSEYLADKKYKVIAANITELYSENNLKLAKLLGINVTVAQASAEQAMIVIKGKSSIASKAAAVAQWVWNSAILANPLVWFVLVIGAVIAGIFLLVKAFDSSADATANAEKAQASYERQARKTQSALEQIEAKRKKSLNDAEIDGRNELNQLRLSGASKEKLANKELEISTRNRNLQIKFSNDKANAVLSEIRSIDANIKAQQSIVNKTDEQIKQINDLIAKKKELAGSYNDEVATIKSTQQDQKDADTQFKLDQEQRNKDAADKRKERVAKTAQAELDIENLKSQKIIDKQKVITDNEKKSLDDRKTALEKSKSEQIAIIERQRDLELKNKELTESERKAITEKAAYDIEKVKSDTEKSITDIEAKELDKRLKKEADTLEAKKQQLANKQASDIEDLSKEYANSIKKAKYASDVVAAQDKYEKDKLAIAQKYRELDFNEGIKSMQAQLALLPSDATARIEIEKAIADAKAKYAQDSSAIAIKANEDVAKNHEESVKKQIELEQQLKDKKQELYQQLQTTIQDIASGVFERKSQEIDEETQKVSDNQKIQTEEIEKKEKAGTMSKASAEKEKSRIDKEAQKQTEALEKEKRKLVREQAILEKAFAAFKIGADTTKAVGAISLQASILASNPLTIAAAPMALAQIPVAIGIGALQLASVMAAPLPKAKYGKVFKGNSHEQGGIPVEVEGDEIIMTKGVYRNPVLRNLASMINQAGGGISFAGGANPNAVFSSGGFASRAIFSDGGYASRRTVENSLTRDDIKRAMKEAVSGLKVVTTIEDIRKADENYTNIEDRANY